MWLWCTLVVAAPVGPLGWEPAYASGPTLKGKKTKKPKPQTPETISSQRKECIFFLRMGVGDFLHHSHVFQRENMVVWQIIFLWGGMKIFRRYSNLHTHTHFHKCNVLTSMGSGDGRMGLGGVWSGSGLGAMYGEYRDRPKSIMARDACCHIGH